MRALLCFVATLSVFGCESEGLKEFEPSSHQPGKFGPQAKDHVSGEWAGKAGAATPIAALPREAPLAAPLPGSTDEPLPPVDPKRRAEILALAVETPLSPHERCGTGDRSRWSELDRAKPHDPATIAALFDIFSDAGAPTSTRQRAFGTLIAEPEPWKTRAWLAAINSSVPDRETLTRDLADQAREGANQRVLAATVQALGTGRFDDETVVYWLDKANAPGLRARVETLLTTPSGAPLSWRLVDIYQRKYGISSALAIKMLDQNRDDLATPALQALSLSPDAAAAKQLIRLSSHPAPEIRRAAAAATRALAATAAGTEALEREVRGTTPPDELALVLAQRAFADGAFERAASMLGECKSTACSGQLMLTLAMASPERRPDNLAGKLRALGIPAEAKLLVWPGAEAAAPEFLAHVLEPQPGPVRVMFDARPPARDEPLELAVEVTNTGKQKVSIESLRLNKTKVGVGPTTTMPVGLLAEAFTLGPKESQRFKVRLAPIYSRDAQVRVSGEVWLRVVPLRGKESRLDAYPSMTLQVAPMAASAP